MINILYDQQRKTMRLRRLTKKMEVLATSNEFTKLSRRSQNKLIRKVQTRIDQLKPFFTISTVRKTVMAAIALVGFLIGIAKTSEAQNFGPMQVNPFGIDTTNYAFIPAAADLDSDGDIDLLVGEQRLGGDVKDNILYYENIGTVDSAWFAAPVRSPFGLGDTTTYAPSIDLVDLDGDGDLDCIISMYFRSDSMCYYENIGSDTMPIFGPKQLNPFGISVVNNASIKFVDIDGDGDYDLTSTNDNYNAVLLYRNNGTPTNPVFNSDTLLLVNTVYSAYGQLAWVDIDHDGDYDLFNGGNVYNGIPFYGGLTFYENIGDSANASFAVADSFPLGLDAWASSGYANLWPEFADMDNDGDYDALIGAWDTQVSGYAGILEYFEDTTGDGGGVIDTTGGGGGGGGGPDTNTTSISSHNIEYSLIIDVYPNPATEKVVITTSGNSRKTIKLYDLHGILIREEKTGAVNRNKYTLELLDLSTGVYYLTVQAGDIYGMRKLVVTK
ncbi:T9SS type A sorting domain-containing protein [bacterium AH-315-C07]|nr:T9SS type A sorting domain-containing protein [bacterium AH-315-C07]